MAREAIGFGGMRLIGAMEVQSGRLALLAKTFGGSVFLLFWFGGDAFSIFHRKISKKRAVTSSTSGGYSLRGVWRSLPGPSRPSCWGQSEAACSSHCVSKCIERSDEGVSALKLKVFVNDYTSSMEGCVLKLEGIAEKGLDGVENAFC